MNKQILCNGIKYHIKNENDCIQQYIIAGKQWNKGMFDFISLTIENNNLKHFLNVGCHIGTISLPISKLINQVSCVEAYNPTYKHLEENIKLNGITNIKSYNFGLGNSNEDIYFMSENKICPIENKNRLKNNSGGQHIFTQNDIDENRRSSILTDKKIKNTIKKLDETDIDNFDIMLVDIEGSEYNFLLGAKNKIMKNKPIIIIEIWNNQKRMLENMNTTREDIIKLIEDMNYKIIGSNGEDFVFQYS